jgi:hypothetical protein
MPASSMRRHINPVEQTVTASLLAARLAVLKWSRPFGFRHTIGQICYQWVNLYLLYNQASHYKLEIRRKEFLFGYALSFCDV